MKKYIEYLILAFLLIYLVRSALIPAWSELQSDFPNYYISSKILLEGNGEKLYHDDWFHEKGKMMGIKRHTRFSPFPPLTALVMVPIAFFKPLAAKRIWTILNIFFLLLAIFLLNKITQWKWHLSAIFILLTGVGLSSNIRLGQVYIVITAMVLLSYFLAQHNKDYLAGIILALCTVLKYFPVVFIVAYAFNKNWRLLSAAMITIIFLFIIQFVIFGPDLMGTYFSTILFPHLEGRIQGQGEFSHIYQTWEVFLKNIFVFNAFENPNPIINWPMGKTLINFMLTALILVPLAYILKKVSVYDSKAKLNIYLYTISLGVFVLLPITATYHFVLISFPVILLLITIKSKLKPIWFWITVSLYAGIGFIPLGIFFELGDRLGLIFYYPRLWIVTVLYFVCLLVTFKLIRNRFILSSVLLQSTESNN